ncbi:MAG: hypothetical protein RJB13_1350 [Pseudomonadota bacterium]
MKFGSVASRYVSVQESTNSFSPAWPPVFSILFLILPLFNYSLLTAAQGYKYGTSETMNAFDCGEI